MLVYPAHHVLNTDSPSRLLLLLFSYGAASRCDLFGDRSWISERLIVFSGGRKDLYFILMQDQVSAGAFPPPPEPPEVSLSDKPPARTTWNNNAQKLLDHVRRKSYQRSGLDVWSYLCSPYSRGDERPLDEDLDVMWQLTDSNSGNPVGSAGMHRVPTITDLSAELWPPIRESPRITSHFDSRPCESAARQKMWREASGAA